MYPNSQDALPLPATPNLEQYRKLAKDLVKTCKSGDPAAVHAWVVRWVGQPEDQVEQFARNKMAASCKLSDAQFVIARACGFLSWPKFISHIKELGAVNSVVSTFESAVEAIVAGDITTLKRLLRENPELVWARSTREHQATLLHYVSANGVEGYRQKSPGNAAEITEILLEAGAEVDAEANVYQKRYTALGLVSTSTPPFVAGVQQNVMDMLLKHGARLDLNAMVGDCLSNGQPRAAEYLASRGAPLDLSGAAGIGRLDVVKQLFKSEALSHDAFSMACTYGHADVAEFLIDHGVDVNVELRGHGEGHTGLHVAAFHARLEVIDTLVRHGASLDIIDKTWHTPPLIWALTGWMRKEPSGGDRYYDAVNRLVRAGAKVTPDLLSWDKAQADAKMLAALKP